MIFNHTWDGSLKNRLNSGRDREPSPVLTFNLYIMSVLFIDYLCLIVELFFNIYIIVTLLLGIINLIIPLKSSESDFKQINLLCKVLIPIKLFQNIIMVILPVIVYLILHETYLIYHEYVILGYYFMGSYYLFVLIGALGSFRKKFLFKHNIRYILIFFSTTIPIFDVIVLFMFLLKTKKLM